MAWAKSQGGDTSRLGIIGFCRGGRTVWRYSTHGNLKAGVAYYGTVKDPPNDAMPLNAIATAKDVKEPVLGLYGAEDHVDSPDGIALLTASWGSEANRSNRSGRSWERSATAT